MRAALTRRRAVLSAAVALLLTAPATGGGTTPDAAADTGDRGATTSGAPAATSADREQAAEDCVSYPSRDWPIARLAGPDRYATAACVATTGYPDGADTVLLARGDAAGGYADALAGTVLAREVDGPVLLTGPTSLASATRQAIRELSPDRVIVLGGPVAVSQRVVEDVRGLVEDVERIQGETRAHTAARIASRVPGDAAFVVNGRRPADALTAGAAAARDGAVLVLADQDGIPGPTRAVLRERSAATIVGGPGVVSTSVERMVDNIVDQDVQRLGGGTRYETAATVARAHPGAGTIHLVSGADGNLVDAIAAGWLAAMPGGGPVVYTGRDAPEDGTDRYLRLGPLADTPDTRILGGPVSLSGRMVDALEARYAEAADGGPRRQLRGMWVHMFDRSLKTRSGIENVLDTAAAANLNTVVVQGTRRHDAFYESDVLPPTTDEQLEDGLDVLGRLIPAAHARGLQVHVWWSLTPSTHTSMQDERLPADHINVQHGAGSSQPWVQRGWIAGYEFLDPAIPGVQDHVVDMITEVVERYDVDGVHLDYLRYACLQAGGPGTCDPRAEAGDPATQNQHPTTMRRWRDHGDGEELGTFMRAQTEDLARRILLEVAAIDPSVVVSGALIAQGEGPTGPSDRLAFEKTKAYWSKGQNWRAWVQKGLLDHVYPMNYFREADPTYARWYDQWTAFADRLDTPQHVTALGQASYLNCVGSSLSQIGESTSRVDGVMLYSYQGDVAGSCGQPPGELFRTLSAPGGPFDTPAAVPPIPRRANPKTGHVLVQADDGDRVELVRAATPDNQGEVVRADATGHAGFVDVDPGRYIVGVEGGGVYEVEVRAGEVARAG